MGQQQKCTWHVGDALDGAAHGVASPVQRSPRTQHNLTTITARSPAAAAAAAAAGIVQTHTAAAAAAAAARA
jgi:hypothetical protein